MDRRTELLCSEGCPVVCQAVAHAKLGPPGIRWVSIPNDAWSGTTHKNCGIPLRLLTNVRGTDPEYRSIGLDRHRTKEKGPRDADLHPY